MSDHEQTLRELARWKGFTEPAQAACLAGADALVRLAALSSAPPDLENLVLTYQRLCRKRDEAHANGKPATAIDAEFELKGIHYGLLAWSPAPPLVETPKCAGPFVSAFDCPKCDALPAPPVAETPDDYWIGQRQDAYASPVVAPARVVEHGDPAIAAKTRAVMAEIAANHFTTVNQCPGLLAFGPIYRALAALSPRETPDGGGR